jgi:AcrR family transcriptional regulator
MRTRSGDKRGDILKASIQIFAQQGFDGAKVASIAHEAKIATGSVYLYFQGKDEILDCLFEEFWDNLLSTMQTIDQPDPMKRLEAQLAAFFDGLADNRAFSMIYLRDFHRFAARPSPHQDSWLACLALGRAAFQEAALRPFDAGDIALSHAYVFGGVRSALEHWMSHDELSRSLVRTRMLTMAIASIAALAKEIE